MFVIGIEGEKGGIGEPIRAGNRHLASQQGRFDSFGQELPEPAWHREDEPEPVYQFQCLKPQGHWKTQEPTWGSGADGKLYDHLKRGKSVFWSGDAQRQRSGSAPLTDCSWCRAMCAI
jgi:hypothetical protein